MLLLYGGDTEAAGQDCLHVPAPAVHVLGAVGRTAANTFPFCNGRSRAALPESQGQNLALTVLHVPYSLDSGTDFP